MSTFLCQKPLSSAMAVTYSQQNLAPGAHAPDFTLKGADDKQHGLEALKGSKATLIVFMCNHCPYVTPKIIDLKRIQKEFGPKGVQVIGINSNNHHHYPEDSFDNMKVLVDDHNLNFPYLFDETQDVARAYEAKCTPDPFLFDENLNLIFHSRINDGGTQEGLTEEMYFAVEEYLNTGQITAPQTPAMGCSIKWQH